MKKIPLFKVFMSEKVPENLNKILTSGYIGQGTEVEEFEKDLSSYIGNSNCITTNSATSALHLAFRLIDIRDKEVISTPLTSPATNMAIVLNGGKIVWADVDQNTGNMDVRNLRIGHNTAAIVCVDWGGIPCDLTPLLNCGIPIVEDASQAFGALYRTEKVGTGHYADYTVFSFQAIKTVTCGDGGALFLKEKFNVHRARLMRWYGIDRERMHDTRDEGNIMEYGDKIHMNNINASIGRTNLEYADGLLEIARSNAEFYKKELYGLVGLPIPHYDCEPTWWQYQIYIDKRDEFIKFMLENGIGADIVNTRNDNHYCFRDFRAWLPNMTNLDKHRVCIPVSWWVTKEDREYIVEKIKEWVKK